MCLVGYNKRWLPWDVKEFFFRRGTPPARALRWVSEQGGADENTTNALAVLPPDGKKAARNAGEVGPNPARGPGPGEMNAIKLRLPRRSATERKWMTSLISILTWKNSMFLLSGCQEKKRKNIDYRGAIGIRGGSTFYLLKRRSHILTLEQGKWYNPDETMHNEKTGIHRRKGNHISVWKICPSGRDQRQLAVPKKGLGRLEKWHATGRFLKWHSWNTARDGKKAFSALQHSMSLEIPVR